MKHTFILSAWWVLGCAAMGQRPSSADTDAELAALRATIAQFARQHDVGSIRRIVGDELKNWQEGRNRLAPSRLVGCAGAVLDVDESWSVPGREAEAEMFWLAREILWKVALMPLGKPTDTEIDLRIRLDAKDSALNSCTGSERQRYAVFASPEVYASIRSDTAGMLTACAGSIHASIIPRYQDKPVLPNNSSVISDPADIAEWERRRPESDRNNRENIRQWDMQKAALHLSDSHDYFLVCAYSRAPLADEELTRVLDALETAQPQREKNHDGYRAEEA